MREQTATALLEHLDRVITPVRRRRRSVWYVACDDDGHAKAMFPVEHVPPEPKPEACVEVSDVFAEAMQHVAEDASMLLVITRPGSVSVVPSDRLWYRAARQVCAERKVPLLGVHLMTAHGRREIFLDDVL